VNETEEYGRFETVTRRTCRFQLPESYLLLVDDAWLERLDGGKQIGRTSQTLLPHLTTLLCIHDTTVGK